MNVRVRFEDEADAEYRAAGRWYETRRVGLGLEFLDAVDAAIGQVVELEAPEELRILAVAHDRREPGYWTIRLA